MKTIRQRAGATAVALALIAGLSSLAVAADDETGWHDTAEFSFVLTGGNSESSTLGFKNTLAREWERSAFTLNAGGIRVGTTTTTRFAVGPDPANAAISEVDVDETTAENYYLNGRYDRKITDRLFWYAQAGWDRNRFAGIDNRYTAVGGVGNVWRDAESLKFRTDYALTYTKQEDVFEVAGADDTFFGARFSWDYLHRFGENTEYVNRLVLDENLDETDDWRADMLNSVAVAMSERLALKIGLQLLYDHMPSFKEITLFDLPPSDPASTPIGTVPFELDELDTIFTVALVVNF